jgi:hypothetical protein
VLLSLRFVDARVRVRPLLGLDIRLGRSHGLEDEIAGVLKLIENLDAVPKNETQEAYADQSQEQNQLHVNPFLASPYHGATVRGKDRCLNIACAMMH